MWRNIFIEACVLSLLVFGGFYINATFLKGKISESEEKVLDQALERDSRAHISGNPTPHQDAGTPAAHISGNISQKEEKSKSSKAGRENSTSP